MTASERAECERRLANREFGKDLAGSELAEDYSCVSMEYALEYGTDKIEVHVDAITPGERVVLVDDLITKIRAMGVPVRTLIAFEGH